MSQPELVRDERFKGRRCGIDNCPSKRYFKIDGRIICDRGHEQEFLETVAEDDGMVPASSQVRRYKIDELDKSESGEGKKRGVLKPLSRDENEFLYLQCYQFVLDGQIKSLSALGLPFEVEGIVKDLWAVYLGALEIKVPNPTQQTRTDGDSQEDEEMTSAREEGDTSASEGRSERGHKYRSDLRELNRYPPLRISITFLYLATVILKLPILMNDLYIWIKTEKIPYLRADRLIPPSMFNRLHSTTQNRFRVLSKLTAKSLHRWTEVFCQFLSQKCNFTIPSLHYPPVLCKLITTMSFPLEVYPVAMQIAKLLNVEEFRLREDRSRLGGYPESKLIGLLIVAAKLAFDIENSIPWREWASGSESEIQKKKVAAYEDLDESDILAMTDEQLDKYMDWMEATWIDEEEDGSVSGGRASRKRIPETILNMFPLEKKVVSSAKGETEREEAARDFFMFVHPKYTHAKKYQIYRVSDVHGPVILRMIQRGSEITGVDEKTLESFIPWWESKLVAWRADYLGKMKREMY